MNPPTQPQLSVRPTRLGRLSWVRIAVPLVFVLTGAFLLRLQVMATANQAQAANSAIGTDWQLHGPVQADLKGSPGDTGPTRTVAEPSTVESEVPTSGLIGP